MKTTVIVVLDLTAPRKLSSNVFNSMIFKLKMKDPGLYRYRRTTLLALFSFILRNESALIVDSKHLFSGVNPLDIGNYIQAYGMQNYYLKQEMLKIRDSLLQSVLLLSLPTKGPHTTVKM